MQNFIEILVQPSDFEVNKYFEILENLHQNITPKLIALLGKEQELIFKLFNNPINLNNFILGVGKINDMVVFKGSLKNLFLSENEVATLKTKWRAYYNFNYEFNEDSWFIEVTPASSEF